MGYAISGVQDVQRFANGNKVGGPQMANVDLNENPIRADLGFAPRSRYAYPVGVRRMGLVCTPKYDPRSA